MSLYYIERRWIGTEVCPNGGTVHVTPLTITSSAPLLNLRTPGDIRDVEPCAACCQQPDG